MIFILLPSTRSIGSNPTLNMDTRKLELQEGTDDLKIIDVGSDNGDEIGAVFLTGDEEFDTNDRRPLAAEIVKRFNDHENMRKALMHLVLTIDSTGGITEHTNKEDGGPVADPEWLDLTEAYLLACETLGREPKYSKD